jgi:hypothetical protein
VRSGGSWAVVAAAQTAIPMPVTDGQRAGFIRTTMSSFASVWSSNSPVPVWLCLSACLAL